MMSIIKKPKQTENVLQFYDKWKPKPTIDDAVNRVKELDDYTQRILAANRGHLDRGLISEQEAYNNYQKRYIPESLIHPNRTARMLAGRMDSNEDWKRRPSPVYANSRDVGDGRIIGLENSRYPWNKLDRTSYAFASDLVREERKSAKQQQTPNPIAEKLARMTPEQAREYILARDGFGELISSKPKAKILDFAARKLNSSPLLAVPAMAGAMAMSSPNLTEAAGWGTQALASIPVAGDMAMGMATEYGANKLQEMYNNYKAAQEAAKWSDYYYNDPTDTY